MSQSKNLNITLKPVMEAGLVTCMQVTYQFDQEENQAGEEICYEDLSTASIPGAEPEDVRFLADGREIPYTVEDNRPYPYIKRHYKAAESFSGKLEISYTVRPRILKPSDICGPYFDLRTEDGGISSAGLSFLMDRNDWSGTISLHWDLADMPEGSTGVCTWGEGDVSREGNLCVLFRQIYYAAGRIKKETEGDFGFYWLSEPSFDIKDMAVYTRKLFGIMQKFFGDKDPVYRIFIRKDPFKNSGGTALMRSYMLGWNDTQPVSTIEKQNILAHEMVHNWPSLNDDPFGITSWYSEGTAEYYSIMIPLRNGLITEEMALNEIQKRTDAYYTNPTRHMENIEAAQICWQDRRAQRLPYGRGIFFLANTDVKIRRATKGEKCIDDVVLSILEADRAGKKLGNRLFLDTVKEIAGIDVTDDWETMRTGGHFAPLEGTFDGHFSIEEKQVPECDTGKTVTSYRWSVKEGQD